MDRIRLLILRYLREEISPAELQELEIWLDADPRHRPFLTGIQDADALAAAFTKLDKLDREKVRARMQAYAAEQRLQEEKSVTVVKMRRLRRTFSAAAAIVLLLSGTYFWSRYKKEDISKPATAQVHDAQPGSSKAILTLSGGRQLVLDSTREDTVLTEGAAIIAGAKGKLAYNPGNQADAPLVYNTLTTPRGGEYQLTLPDGTKVWLNAASSITYPTAFTGKERKVVMTGEAYFEVSKNASQPFKVSVNGKEEVEVLGTSFNVNAYDNESTVKTTLLEGSVRVAASLQPVVGVNSGKEKLGLVLKPGEQSELVVGENTNNGSATKGQLKLLTGVDIEAVVAWKNGRFAFTDADLQTVMRQLARWYNVDVTYEGNIPTREFDGKIGKTLTLDQVLKILTKTRVHYSIEGRQLTIRP
jgi:ferric-dicitrate binding protein FerR (iron transport regulator)